MTTNQLMRRRSLFRRRGMMSIEVAMTIAVMVPIAAALLFLGVWICSALYQAIGTLVSWPFL